MCTQWWLGWLGILVFFYFVYLISGNPATVFLILQATLFLALHRDRDRYGNIGGYILFLKKYCFSLQFSSLLFSSTPLPQTAGCGFQLSSARVKLEPIEEAQEVS